MVAEFYNNLGFDKVESIQRKAGFEEVVWKLNIIEHPTHLAFEYTFLPQSASHRVQKGYFVIQKKNQF
jgi:hypothetical protein